VKQNLWKHESVLDLLSTSLRQMAHIFSTGEDRPSEERRFFRASLIGGLMRCPPGDRGGVFAASPVGKFSGVGGHSSISLSADLDVDKSIPNYYFF